MKKGNKKFSILQGSRLLLQIVFFIFLPTLYIGALNGVKQIYLAVIHQNISVDVLPQLIEVIAIIPITIVFGRFFCGWMCGFGSFSDFVYRVSRKIFKNKLKLNEQTDAWMKAIKYVVLAVLIVAVWSFNITVFSTASPWDVFGMLATVGKAPDFSYVILNLAAGFVILLVIIAASAVIERFFCRYLCPMGAIFAITSKLRIAKIKKPSAQCGGCRMCTNNCAMGIPLYKMDAVNSGECINCMKCISVCPRGNTDFTVARNDIRPLIAGVATVAAMTGIYYTGDLTVNAAEIGTTATITQANSPASSNQIYKDGTYQGSGSGFRGATTTVSVTFKNDKITDISTVSYGDDAPFYNRCYSAVTQEIISSQSVGVDAVSGATFSSNGIMQAVSDAMDKAKIVGYTSPSSQSSGDFSSDSSSAQSSSSAKGDTATSGKYKDGTYQGSGTGFRGSTTTVSVVVSNGEITAINVDSYRDDTRFFRRAYSAVSQEIISSQSANVDAVSGATFSSNGIMQAVENALSNAAA